MAFCNCLASRAASACRERLGNAGAVWLHRDIAEIKKTVAARAGPIGNRPQVNNLPHIPASSKQQPPSLCYRHKTKRAGASRETPALQCSVTKTRSEEKLDRGLDHAVTLLLGYPAEIGGVDLTRRPVEAQSEVVSVE